MVVQRRLARQQLAQAITIYRSGQAAETVKAATDLTNQLLEANADNLRQANAQTRTQIERGVFDIETVKKAEASDAPVVIENRMDRNDPTTSAAMTSTASCERSPAR